MNIESLPRELREFIEAGEMLIDSIPSVSYAEFKKAITRFVDAHIALESAPDVVWTGETFDCYAQYCTLLRPRFMTCTGLGADENGLYPQCSRSTCPRLGGGR